MYLFILLLSIMFSSAYSSPTDIPTRGLIARAHLGAGFFAEVNKVVGALMRANREDLKSPVVDWTLEFFPYKDKPHENGWDLYFEPIKEGYDENLSLQYQRIFDQTLPNPWVQYEQYLQYRLDVNAIWKKYIRIKPQIVEKLNAFYDQHLKNYIAIGVHVRFATSHSPEVPGGRAPTIDEYCQEIDAIRAMLKDQKYKIFLATDSHYVVKEFERRYGSHILVYQRDAFRADYKQDPHLIYENTQYWITHPAEFHQKKPGFKGGESTLLECLLLAKCHYLIHTMSNVSNFACYVNPYIQQLFLPKNVKPKRPLDRMFSLENTEAND